MGSSPPSTPSSRFCCGGRQGDRRYSRVGWPERLEPRRRQREPRQTSHAGVSRPPIDRTLKSGSRRTVSSSPREHYWLRFVIENHGSVPAVVLGWRSTVHLANGRGPASRSGGRRDMHLPGATSYCGTSARGRNGRGSARDADEVRVEYRGLPDSNYYTRSKFAGRPLNEKIHDTQKSPFLPPPTFGLTTQGFLSTRTASFTPRQLSGEKSRVIG